MAAGCCINKCKLSIQNNAKKPTTTTTKTAATTIANDDFVFVAQ